VHDGACASSPLIDEFYTEAILLVLSMAAALIERKRISVPGSNTTKQSTTSLSWRAA